MKLAPVSNVLDN